MALSLMLLPVIVGTCCSDWCAFEHIPKESRKHTIVRFWIGSSVISYYLAGSHTRFPERALHKAELIAFDWIEVPFTTTTEQSRDDVGELVTINYAVKKARWGKGYNIFLTVPRSHRKFFESYAMRIGSGERIDFEAEERSIRTQISDMNWMEIEAQHLEEMENGLHFPTSVK